MKTTVKDLEKRVAALPPDFEKYVGIINKGKVKVKSFSSSAVYDVSIRRGEKDGDLEATCTCPATRVCHHITSFFAVAKGLSPTAPVEDTPEPDEGQQTGSQLIAAAVEQLITGINLAVREHLEERS